MQHELLADVVYGSEAVILGLAELVRLAPDRDIKSGIVDVGFGPIVLQKSFCTGDQKFCGP
jgi:hypothetical protein